MKRVYFGKDGQGKLVRDNLPELLTKQGYPYSAKVLLPSELASHIVGKMPEEVNEIKFALANQSKDALVEEIADLIELIDSLVKVANVTKEDLADAKQRKTDSRGSFTTGQFIHYVDLVETGNNYDYWVKYFSGNPGYVVKEI